jgi:isopropylmalate/citramalate/homocitrate synthase-like protein
MEKIRIFDTTLRDGEGTPGVSLTPEDKLVIARQLDRLGVNAIEIGTPITSKGEMKSARTIIEEGLRAEVYALSRVVKEDVDAIIKSNVEHIHLFIATSDLHLKHKLRMTRKDVLQKSLEIIDYAKTHGLLVEFSAEDATRSDLTFLKHFYKTISEAGIIRINVPDTVGVMTPRKMYQLITEIKAVVRVPISVHCHNDFGMAVANSVAGVEAGAEQVHVTINGLGERAGNAALEEVVLTLNRLYNKKIKIKTESLYRTSQLISKLTKIPLSPNKAIVGDNAFAHEVGIHTHGVVAQPLTYEPFPPELVGQIRKIIPGKYSGKHGIKAELESVGLYPTDVQIEEIVRQVRARGDRGKIVTDVELMKITKDITGQKIDDKKLIELGELSVMTGTNMTPTASVRIILNGKEFSSAETGVGPVDAAVRAIQKITRNLVNVQLKEYRLEALTGGSNAVAEVIVKVEDNLGNIVSARSANEDIVKASVNAMITGINRILLKKKEEKV